jgi:hypothetical protein
LFIELTAGAPAPPLLAPALEGAEGGSMELGTPAFPEEHATHNTDPNHKQLARVPLFHIVHPLERDCMRRL